MSDNLINVYGCFKCQKLAGNLRAEYVTGTKQGYEICPICRADLDYFWLNLTYMKFQQTRPITKEMMEESFKIAGGIGCNCSCEYECGCDVDPNVTNEELTDALLVHCKHSKKQLESLAFPTATPKKKVKKCIELNKKLKKKSWWKK